MPIVGGNLTRIHKKIETIVSRKKYEVGHLRLKIYKTFNFCLLTDEKLAKVFDLGEKFR